MSQRFYFRAQRLIRVPGSCVRRLLSYHCHWPDSAKKATGPYQAVEVGTDEQGPHPVIDRQCGSEFSGGISPNFCGELKLNGLTTSESDIDAGRRLVWTSRGADHRPCASSTQHWYSACMDASSGRDFRYGVASHGRDKRGASGEVSW